MNQTTTRPIFMISNEIRVKWNNPDIQAKPYLRAMENLKSIRDSYQGESARNILLFFLKYAITFNTPVSTRIKAELHNLILSELDMRVKTNMTTEDNLVVYGIIDFFFTYTYCKN